MTEYTGVSTPARIVFSGLLLGWSPLEVALVWVRDRHGVTAPVLGSRTAAQLRSALGVEDKTSTRGDGLLLRPAPTPRTAADAVATCSAPGSSPQGIHGRGKPDSAQLHSG